METEKKINRLKKKKNILVQKPNQPNKQTKTPDKLKIKPSQKTKMGEEKKCRNNFHHFLKIAILFLVDMLVAAQRYLLLASKCQNRCSRMLYHLKQIDHVECQTDFCFLPRNSVCSHFRCQTVRQKCYC